MSAVTLPTFQLLNMACRCYLRESVKKLHLVGLHHHDLQFRNVVRDDNGTLSIINLETAIKVDPSSGCRYKHCPDDAWIEEIQPCSVF